MCLFRVCLCNTLRHISKATNEDIDAMLKAIMKWQNQRFPDWELVILSLPKYDREEREFHLGCMAELLRKYQ